MQQTLFIVPHNWLGAPLLIAWLAIVAVLIGMMWWRNAPGGRIGNAIAVLILGAIVIYGVLPRLEVAGLDVDHPDGPLVPLGLAVRGYGVFLMLGILAGVFLCQWRARQIGVDPDKILSLCFWLTICGLIGARLFFVIQKWDSFADAPSVAEWFGRLLNMTEGGLVVFGSLIGGLVAWIVFCLVARLPMWQVADIMAPGMMIGLAFGRIGCLMNGCCFGGVCESPLPGVTFPAGAPAYYRQLDEGALLGLDADRVRLDGGRVSLQVKSVASGSAADRSGIRPGDVITQVAPPSDLFVRAVFQDRIRFSAPERNSVLVQLADRPLLSIPVQELPARSLRTHPTQVYSAINALLLCLLLWFYYPFRRADGELMALLLVLYSISRFLLEIIRADEPGVLGTDLTVSQWVALGCLPVGIALFFSLRAMSPIPRGPQPAV
jgi:phosphatidylglycerol:prolipoprotein diacylglycerol transferase